MGFKSVSKKFNRCSRRVSKVFQGSFKGISRKMEGVHRDLQGYLKNYQRVFQVSFNAVSKTLECSGMFRESVTHTSRKFPKMFQ